MTSEIRVPRSLLEEMINVKVFECETNLIVKIANLIKPCNARAESALDVANLAN